MTYEWKFLTYRTLGHVNCKRTQEANRGSMDGCDMWGLVWPGIPVLAASRERGGAQARGKAMESYGKLWESDSGRSPARESRGVPQRSNWTISRCQIDFQREILSDPILILVNYNRGCAKIGPKWNFHREPSDLGTLFLVVLFGHIDSHVWWHRIG